MGKLDRKKGMADKKSRPANKVQSNNPFEVHVNRSKFNVLGRKSKNDRGLPGVSRAKFIKKRKVTLLQEYKVKNKTNRFMDRRIGEHNSAMTREDRILARFTAERMKAHKRKATMFNLADDEVLTHGGRSLAEIERFDDPRSDDDDDAGGGGALDSQFVEEAHFGGGMLRKSESGAASRMSVIDQLIADSKRRKAERQATKEKTLEMTEQLDTEWRELVPLVSTMTKQRSDPAKGNELVEKKEEGCGTRINEIDIEVEKKDSYDLLMNELKFTARGKPTDRLKSENEVAVEEARHLQQLEEERLRRMRGDLDGESTKHGVASQTSRQQHRSADDLDDGLDIDEPKSFSLMYNKDGVAIGLENDGDEEDTEGISAKVGDEDPEYEDEEGEDEGEGIEGSENESGEESDDSLTDLKTTLDLDDDSEDEVEFIPGEGLQQSGDLQEEATAPDQQTITPKPVIRIVEEEEDGCEKKGDHVEVEGSGELVGQKKQKKKVTFNSEIQVRVDRGVSFPDGPLLDKDPPSNVTDEESHKNETKQKITEETAKQIPFTFKVPKSYEELEELFDGRSPEERSVILERMIKCNHPSLGENNKAQLADLFAYILQTINDAQYDDCWRNLEAMVPFMFDLVQFSPDSAANYLREVINEKYMDFIKKKEKYPPIETLMFLKLVSLLFPTSDKIHAVSTPAMVFICHILDCCRVTSRASIASGLFLVSLIVEYTSLSGRFFPQAINFLCGLFHLASPPPGRDYTLTPVPPFRPEHRLLYVQNSVTGLNKLKMCGSDLVPNGPRIDDSFRVRSLHTAIEVAHMLATLYHGSSTSDPLPAASIGLQRLAAHANALQLENYPEIVKEKHQKLCKLLDSISSEDLQAIIVEERKPKALRLYKPNIQPVYEGRKRKLLMSEEKAEHQKLLHKYKKEMKGAIRELRRDRVFLSKLKIKQQVASDNERKQRVKQIYSWGAQQQGEIKQLERKKRKK